MKKIIYILTVLAAVLTVTACTTTKEISSDLSANQIMQLGQEAYSNEQYKDAEYYYNQALIRYGFNDPATYIECRYELGHIYIKTKNYEKAYTAFTEILDIYNSTGGANLSPSYKTLAQKGINQIPEAKLKELQAE